MGNQMVTSETGKLFHSRLVKTLIRNLRRWQLLEFDKTQEINSRELLPDTQILFTTLTLGKKTLGLSKSCQ